MRYLWIAAPAGVLFAGGLCVAASTDIDQVGQKFSQTSLGVGRGDVVRFINHDDVTHNINVIDANDIGLDKGLQKPGESIEQVFDAAGKFVVRCGIHPKMKMTVAVK